MVLVDTYHELPSPYETVRAALTTLKRGGLLAVVEYKSTLSLSRSLALSLFLPLLPPLPHTYIGLALTLTHAPTV